MSHLADLIQFPGQGTVEGLLYTKPLLGSPESRGRGTNSAFPSGACALSGETGVLQLKETGGKRRLY